MAFLPDGYRLASACDSTVRLWDVGTHNNIQTLYTKNLIRDGSFLQRAFRMLELKHLGHSQPSSASLLIHVREEWVFWGEDNILWLPFEYRPSHWAIKNNILALGHKSGRVTFIEFNPNYMPVGETQ